MNSQLATWHTSQLNSNAMSQTEHVSIQLMQTRVAHSKQNILNLSNTQSTFHTRAQNKNDRTKTPNDKQTHHSQHRQLQHIMTNGTLPHNNTVQKLRKPCGKPCRLMNMMTNISRKNYNGGCACAGRKPTNMSKVNYRFPDYCLHTTPPKLLPPHTTVSPIVVCNRTC